MGLGDQLIGTGLARGARARGKRIAFGDGKRIAWYYNSETIFRGNPNIAAPGSEHGRRDLEWIPFYKGSRLYNRHDRVKNRWIWNMDFRCKPGELFFSEDEKAKGDAYGTDFIVIEPTVPSQKSCAPNKDWGRENYQAVADRLRSEGGRLVQLVHGGSGRPLNGVQPIATSSFRDALAVLANASLYIGPEGGLHHGAAAVGIAAVVLFGGFIPPAVTGYDTHINLTGGADACGNINPCSHCRAAMKAISVNEVFSAAQAQARERTA
jgi:hypothetical protein